MIRRSEARERDRLLAAWQTRMPFVHGDDLDRLRTAILPALAQFLMLRPDMDAGPARLIEAGKHVGPAAFQLAKPMNGNYFNDLFGSLLLLSASHGFLPAAHALAQLQLERARWLEEEESWPDEAMRRRAARSARRLRRLAVAWLSDAAALNICSSADFWAKQLGNPCVPSWDSLEGPGSPPANRPTKVVAAVIGEAETAEGRAIAARYRRLTEPLPLRGGDADPDLLTAVLGGEAPNMLPLFEHALGELRLRRSAGAGWARFSPVLLVGPPGVGKTRAAKRLGQLLGTGFADFSLAGAPDGRLVTGTARGWSSAQPGAPLLALLRAGTANPVILVDEVDKAGSGHHNGNAVEALLPLLEPETAAAHFDPCLLAEADLSGISWILTANDLSRLPDTLLSRVSVVPVGPPKDFDTVLRGLLADIARELGIGVSDLPEVGNAAVAELMEAFAAGRSIRDLKRAVRRALVATANMFRLLH